MYKAPDNHAKHKTSECDDRQPKSKKKKKKQKKGKAFIKSAKPSEITVGLNERMKVI